MGSLPNGTVTFLFTDIEDSTRLAQQYPEAIAGLLARHRAILNQAIEGHGGYIFQIVGDAFCASFQTVRKALDAALAAQRSLAAEPWSPEPIRVRMGISTGSAEIELLDDRQPEYAGYVNLARTQRAMSVAYGGQILLTDASAMLVRGELPADVGLRDLGEHRLKSLLHTERLWQVVAPGLQADFPPIQSLDGIPNNLPVQLTSFIGRRHELRAVRHLLKSHRLVTLTGAGGTGKTRLALEVGARLVTDGLEVSEFTNGVYFVALAALTAAEAIVPTIAAALGLSFNQANDPRQQLLDYLRERSLLLILDNFEHVLPGVALLNDILSNAPGVSILATSRARLNLSGEQLFHLLGMGLPDEENTSDAAQYDAIQLFLDSAKRTCPEFELRTEDAKYVVRICRGVNGMPLGIMLAAAWLETLTPQEVAEEMGRGLDFLATAELDVPERQQSMRAVFDYSWSLLTPGEQRVFEKASVFRGGFTREAAQQVTGASLRDLMGLVDKSLLQHYPNGRYGVHELLRQYAAEKLSLVPTVQQCTREQHCAYYANLLHQHEAQLHQSRQRDALSQIEVDIDNLRSGWAWAVEHQEVDRLAEYLGSLGELYHTRGWSHDGAELFSRAAESLSMNSQAGKVRATDLLRGRLLYWQGRLTDAFDTAERASQLFRESVAILREAGAPREMAYALCYSGGSDSLYGDAKGEAGCQEGFAIFTRLGDQRGIALALRGLAWVALHQGEYSLAKERFQESLARFRKAGDEKEIAHSLGGLGYVCWIQGDYQASSQHHGQMLALCRQTGDQAGIARALGDLGIDAFGMQDYERAREIWLESLALYRQLGDTWGMADELGDLAAGALVRQQHARAAELAQQSLALPGKSSRWMHSWELMILGRAALGMGDSQQAKDCLAESLTISLMARRRGHILLALVGVAEFLIQEGRDEAALELLYLVISHRASWQMARDQAAGLIAKLEVKLRADASAEAAARGRSRDLEKTTEEVLVQLRQ